MIILMMIIIIIIIITIIIIIVYPYIYIYMYVVYIWLVVEPTPLEKHEFVSWDDAYSQLNGKIIQMFQTTNQIWIYEHIYIYIYVYINVCLLRVSMYNH